MLHILLLILLIVYFFVELENEILMVAQHSLDLQTSVLIYPITIETIHVCANTTGDRSVKMNPYYIKIYNSKKKKFLLVCIFLASINSCKPNDLRYGRRNIGKDMYKKETTRYKFYFKTFLLL